MLIAALIFAAGAVSSLLGSSSVARWTADRAHKAFVTSSVEIAGTLQLAIQRQQDLIVSAEAFVLGDPHPSQAAFARWAGDVQVLGRHPEVLGVAIIDYVPAAQIEAYVRAASLADSTPFVMLPPGKRSFYCFSLASVARPAAAVPSAIDLCAGPGAKVFAAARSSGKSSIFPYTSRGIPTFSLDVPIYRGATVPSTVAGREKAFVELIGMGVLPDTLLSTALQGQPGTEVALRFGTGASSVVFRGGVAHPGAQTEMIDLHDGWTVETLRILPGSGLLSDAGAVGLLIGGLALSLLIGALIFVLGTGRARSMVLVDERTEELRFQALHDSLTGLPNRALIMDRIEQLLSRSRRNGTVGAALYVDLDDFKNVNDTLGHEAGDRLLVSVATRMQGTLRGADTIGRMGGDEFVVLIDGGDLTVAPELVAERIIDVMAQPFELAGAATPVVVNTSIGIALANGASAGELLRDADVALYQAKIRGKNRYEFFRPEMQADIGRRVGLEFDLRAALEGDQFRLVYQPIYNLDDLAVVAVEALLRWQHPIQGRIQPDEFIPILEQSGQIREVGAWVLRRACEQMAAWHRLGDTLDVSVNVSRRQLDDDRIVTHVREALERSGLKATSLIIEVTETALMRDADAARQQLRAIKALGVRIAVDDFGTGYSSLGYLQGFPVDSIKIDKSFTNALGDSPESKAFVRTLVQLGRDLGLRTLAEGVETAEEMDLLRANHVNEVQGFLFSRPLDPEVLESQLLAPMRRRTGAAPVEE